MSSRREFEIAFVGLKPGIHEFNYRIQDRFFEAYQQQDFRHCEAQVNLKLDKNNGFMLLKFEVSGKLEVICDRCGNTLPLELWDEFNILAKLVENPEQMNQQEEDPDVYYISRGESHLHVADWIYEFINLSIPTQRMCREKEMGGPHCNKEVLAMLSKMDSEKSAPENPMWKELKKFKDLE
ncbi:MAG: YceD family protein [Chitinophagales bacterium]